MIRRRGISALLLLSVIFSGTAGGFRDTLNVGVHGFVVGDEGKPVPMTRVSLVETGAAQADMLRTVETKANGEFLFEHWRFGNYMVVTEKEGDGYPSTLFDFYQTTPNVRVLLDAAHPVREVKIAMGPRGGRLLGVIKDLVTGNKVEKATFRFWRVGDQQNWAEVAGRPNYDQLLPAGVKIAMKVFLSGYKDWYYPGAKEDTEANSFTLRSGENRALDIGLEPLRKNP